MARTGRRPGTPDTREAILDAARSAFAEKGYAGTSIRGIAAAAGVDPALVHHYFGNKDELFLQAVEIQVDLPSIAPRVLADGVDHAGERLVLTLLGLWDSPVGVAAAALFRSAVDNEKIAKMMINFVVQRIITQISKEIGVPAAERAVRTSLVATQMAGLIVFRYIFGVEPLATMSPKAIAALIGPNVQRYINGPLPRI